MGDLGRAPACTEADLRAAFAELARQAPSADDVLSALHEARSRGPRRWPQLAVGAAAAVTVLAVTLALTLSGSPGRTGGPDILPALPNPPASAGALPVVSPGGHLSARSLAKAMLTAFSAASDDLVYFTQTGFTRGHLAEAEQSWNWPAIPSPGQVEYVRETWSQIPRGASRATAPVKLTEDNGYTTIVPHPSRYDQKENARLITVCYAGTGQTGCGFAGFETRPGTWSKHTGLMWYLNYAPSPRGADLARQIARGQWRIVGHTHLRGQRAIKLISTRSGPVQGTVFLWVSTATYLPLRMAAPGKFTGADNWYYLLPSEANLAHLRVPIPRGYPRSG